MACTHAIAFVKSSSSSLPCIDCQILQCIIHVYFLFYTKNHTWLPSLVSSKSCFNWMSIYQSQHDLNSSQSHKISHSRGKSTLVTHIITDPNIGALRIQHWKEQRIPTTSTYDPWSMTLLFCMLRSLSFVSPLVVWSFDWRLFQVLMRTIIFRVLILQFGSIRDIRK